MEKIFTTQDGLKIELSYLGKDVAKATAISEAISSVKIKYSKPNGDLGEWDATHVKADRKVYYDLELGEYLSIPGVWRFWILALLTDGRKIPSDPIARQIYEEGNEEN